MLTKATFKIKSWDEEPFDEPDSLDQGDIMKSFQICRTDTGCCEGVIVLTRSW